MKARKEFSATQQQDPAVLHKEGAGPEMSEGEGASEMSEADSQKDRVMEMEQSSGNINVSPQMLKDSEQVVISDNQSGEVLFDSETTEIDPVIGLELPYSLEGNPEIKISVSGGLSPKDVAVVTNRTSGSTGGVFSHRNRWDGHYVDIGDTQLAEAFRGITAANFDDELFADPVQDADGYEFMFEAAGGFEQITETSDPTGRLVLPEVLNLLPDVTYSVRVRARIGSDYGNYGQAYNYSTPNPDHCNWLLEAHATEFEDMSFNFSANNTGTAQAWEWSWAKADGSWSDIRTGNGVYWNYYYGWLPSEAHAYGTAYRIRIREQNGGVWGEWGPTREATSVVFPGVKLRDQDTGQLDTLAKYIHNTGTPIATNYEWEFRADDHVFTRKRNHTTTNFYVGWEPLHFGHPYEVRVRPEVGGEWLDYGPVQNIIAPIWPETKLRDSDVGGHEDISGYFHCDNVVGATNFRWEFDSADPADPHTLTFTRNHVNTAFHVGWVDDFQWNTVYNVRVKTENGGVWGEYGPSRQFWGPSDPRVKLRDQYIGLWPTLNAYYHAEWIHAAENYQWEFESTDPADPHVLPFTRNWPNTSVHGGWVSGWRMNREYNVRVRMYNGGTWYNWGDTQVINTPPQPDGELRSDYRSRFYTGSPGYIHVENWVGTSDWEWEAISQDESYSITYFRGHPNTATHSSWLGLSAGHRYNIRVRGHDPFTHGNFGPAHYIVWLSHNYRLKLGGGKFLNIPQNSALEFAGGYAISLKLTLDQVNEAQFLVDCAIDPSEHNGYGLFVRSSNLLRFVSHQKTHQVTGGTELQAGVEYTVVVVHQEDGYNKIYIDGVLDGTSPVAAPHAASDTTNLQIGHSALFDRQLEGGVNQLVFWNTELTQAEVTELQGLDNLSTHSKFDDMVSWFNFEESLEDYLGLGNAIENGGIGPSDYEAV